MEPTQPAPTVPPIAIWDGARDVWTRPPVQTMLPIFEPSDVYSGTFPISVSMRRSSLFLRPMLGPRTPGSGSSSSPSTLLPSPDAYSADRGGTQHPAKRQKGGHQPTLADHVEHTLPHL